MSNWITAPFESIEGENLVMCTVRTDVSRFRENPRFRFRVEVEWPYEPAAGGMPPESLGHELEAVADALQSVLKADPVAVLTGIYTGNGSRTMVFYTLSLHIFQRKFNEALTDFPALPLEFEATRTGRNMVRCSLRCAVSTMSSTAGRSPTYTNPTTQMNPTDAQ